jgi:hypothetical protein
MPNLKLTGIEYLCLKMATTPGKSGRWYLNELHKYKFAKPITATSWNALYLAPSGKYRGILFNDLSPKSRPSHGVFTTHCSKVGSYHLTPAGHKKAQIAAQKIGLDI